MSGLISSGTRSLHFDDMTPEQYEQFKVDTLNETVGNRNKDDGYICHECKNKGYIAKLEMRNGRYYQVLSDCKCIPVRNTIMKMIRSGLRDVISECTFDKWEATEDWQRSVKAAAIEYAKNPKGWFFIGGQPGCGKTHLCTAICRELLLEGKNLKYMQWREDAAKLKGNTNDTERREKLTNEFKTVKALYIDDLFKTGKNQDGSVQRPTSADINLAFEILNYRYNKPDSITIISSELTAEALLDIDEAIGSRICERSKPLNISRNIARNYRLRNQITL